MSSNPAFRNPDAHIPRASRPPSVFSSTSTTTLVADRFPSEEAYLQALREWAESKKYYENDIQLQGFYGTKTSEYYKNRPGLRSKKEKSRRSTAAKLEAVAEQEQEDGMTRQEESSATKGLKKFFGRRKTVA